MSAGARFVKKGWGGGAGTSFDAWLTSSAAQVGNINSNTSTLQNCGLIMYVTPGSAYHKSAFVLVLIPVMTVANPSFHKVQSVAKESIGVILMISEPVYSYQALHYLLQLEHACTDSRPFIRVCVHMFASDPQTAQLLGHAKSAGQEYAR